MARLIAHAATHTQIVVVSHSPVLSATLEKIEGCRRLHLEKSFGETTVAGQTKFNTPKWEWPSR
jgi:predicted ATPase